MGTSTFRTHRWIGAGLVVWSSTIAAAQTTQNQPRQSQLEPSEGVPARIAVPNRDWTIRFEPSAWFLSPAGKLRMPRSGSGASTSRVELVDLGLDRTRFEPFGEIHVLRDRWRITLSGTWLSEQSTAIIDSSGRLGDAPFAAGDAIATDFTLATFQAMGAARVYRYQGGPDGQGGHDLVATVDLTAGVRVYYLDVDASVASAPGGAVLASTGDSEFFAEPVVGVKGELVMIQDFSVDLELTAGGFVFGDTSVVSVDVIVGGTWRPTPTVGLQLGYRQLAYFLSSGSGGGEFEYNGTIAGLYGGLDLRF